MNNNGLVAGSGGHAVMTVVSVLSSSRSGSTVLATLLGQVSDVFYAGELQPLWGPAWLPDELCSCGQPVLACPVWQPILEQLLDADLTAHIPRLRRLRDSTTRARHVLLPRWFAGREQSCADFLKVTEQLYLNIQRVTGCRLVVDTSKSPSYVVMVGRIPKLECRVIHLVRDPRAMVFSWSRSKRWKNAKGEQPRWMPAYKAASHWLVQNGLIELFRPRFPNYIRVRYEDFAADPHRILTSLLDFMGMPTEAVAESFAQRKARHILGANPDRFKPGAITIRLDDEWRRHMSPVTRWIVTSLTWPLMRKYGYLRN